MTLSVNLVYKRAKRCPRNEGQTLAKLILSECNRDVTVRAHECATLPHSWGVSM